MMTFYILDADKHVIRLGRNEAERWCDFMCSKERIVAQTRLGDVLVSTVFLGLDHGWGRKGPPILFETMIFGGEFDEDCWRYSSWDDAEAGHNAAVRKVRVKVGECNG
jgi:hypothetical protein